MILKKVIKNFKKSLILFTHSGKKFKNISILNLPFSKNRFDLILCNHVLEHVKNDSQALKKLYGILSITGCAILQVPVTQNSLTTTQRYSLPKEREKFCGQANHQRIYGQDYPIILRSCGFKVKKVEVAQNYLQHEVIKNEIVFKYTKQ